MRPRPNVPKTLFVVVSRYETTRDTDSSAKEEISELKAVSTVFAGGCARRMPRTALECPERVTEYSRCS